MFYLNVELVRHDADDTANYCITTLYIAWQHYISNIACNINKSKELSLCRFSHDN